MYFKLSPEIFQALVQYLSKRPWAEVTQLLATLDRLPKVEESSEQPKDFKKKDKKK